MESRLTVGINRSDPDTELKVRSSIRSINDTIQSNANEPSLAFFRIQVIIISLSLPHIRLDRFRNM